MKVKYADLQSRVKAVIIDSVILILVMYCTSIVLDNLENVKASTRAILAILYLVLYEPIMVTCFGFTLGHYYCDIHVKKATDLKSNVSFPVAFIRFIIKFLLGWLSLITVTSSTKKQAIHDTVVDAVVLKDSL